MNPRFVTFHYVLKNKEGAVLESNMDAEPMMFLEGASQVMPSLEAGIREMKVGEKKIIYIHSANAYGSRDENLVIDVPLTELPSKKPVHEGQKFSFQSKNKPPRTFRVTKVCDTYATLDGNHPLAGQDLFFDVEIKGAREASRDEITIQNFSTDESNGMVQ